MEKKYAFVLMGAHYDPEIHRCTFDMPGRATLIQTARNFSEARETAMRLKNEGFGAIELCGAFTSVMAAELVEATGREVAIGYSVHDPGIDHLFAKFFG